MRLTWHARVNGVKFYTHADVEPELAADPSALAQAEALATRRQAERLARERWGKGVLSGEHPTYTWGSSS